MRVNVLAFARIRELLGGTEHVLDLPAGAGVRDVWDRLCERNGDLRVLEESTRIARNGRIVTLDEQLADGDEVALLPPAGGG